MEILYLLLSIHLFFDYGIQNEKKINKRTIERNGNIVISHFNLLVHGLTQMIPIFILFLFDGIRWYDVILITLALFTHLGIDYIKLNFKIKLMKSKEEIGQLLEKDKLNFDELIKDYELKNSLEGKEVSLYVLDQISHILVIAFIYIYIGTNLITGSRISIIENTYIIGMLNYVKYPLALLLIGSFFNITFKLFTQKYKPIDLLYRGKNVQQDSNELENNKNEEILEPKQTGALIGTLERILVLMALMANSYVVVGYIIAAKSIARFEKMKDKEFAEYYLIGTLSSLIWSIVVFYILLK